MNMTSKEEMRIVGVFKHKDNYYVMLLNDKCNKYYMRLENNTLHNITLEEYIDINKTYFSPKIVMGHKKIEVEPLIRLKNKLIPLALATSIVLSLGGCGKVAADPNIAVDSIAIEQTDDRDVIKTIEGLNDIGIGLSRIGDTDLYRIEKISLGDNKEYQGIDFSALEQAKYDSLVRPNEFNKYIDKENVTYEDIKQVIAENPNLSDGIKKVLYNGVCTMQAKGFNPDLSVLYYNLQRLQIEYLDPGALGNNIGEFDHVRGVVTIDGNITTHTQEDIETVITHEILGHGLTRAYIPDKKVMCEFMNTYLEINDQGLITSAGYLGHFGNEGIADLVTAIATDRKITTETAGYTTEVYEVASLCSSLGISIEDYVNNGIPIIVDKMYEKGIDNPVQTISVFDNTTALMQQNAMVQADLTNTFIDYYGELIEDKAVDADTLVDSSNAYKEYVDTFALDENLGELVIKLNDEDTLSWINPEMVTYSIENINSLSR